MTPAEFSSAFPAFAATDPAQVQRVINEALVAPGLDAAKWGARYSSGLGNLVAHELTMENREAQLGPAAAIANATTKSVGRVSVTKSNAMLSNKKYDDLWYQETYYGRKYLMLRDLSGSGALVVTG